MSKKKTSKYLSKRKFRGANFEASGSKVHPTFWVHRQRQPRSHETVKEVTFKFGPLLIHLVNLEDGPPGRT